MNNCLVVGAALAAKLFAYLAELQRIKTELLRFYAMSIAWQGGWLRQKVRGYFQYHAVPGNQAALNTVRREVNRLGLRTLRRRSQRHDLPWSRFTRCVRRWIPSIRVLHPYPNQRFAF